MYQNCEQQTKKKIIWKTGRAMGKNIFSGQVKQFVNHHVVVTEELMKRPVDVQMPATSIHRDLKYDCQILILEKKREKITIN